ncbi:FtsX-like permease family protein [Pontiellaceae bacterium B12227]|nr:FtsX-like permease family protein [Pontiellaceae bacterium B12227]
MIRLVLSSLNYFRRGRLSVFLGVVLASAVLTGSLLMGDSVDGSLRTFALQRLGNIQYAMHTPERLVDRSLADRLGNHCAAALVLRGMALSDEQQVNRVQVVDAEMPFFRLAGVELTLDHHEVALNEKLAKALGVSVGDEVSLRIERPGLLPSEAPLAAQKTDRTARGRFKVVRVLGDDELGRFGLAADQVVPYNAFVNFLWQDEGEAIEEKANLLISADTDPSVLLSRVWKPADFGLIFREAGGVLQLEAENVYLESEAARAAMSVPGAQGTLTYLVNSISNGGNSTPYSFVLAQQNAALAEDEMMLNEWLASELEAAPGDAVQLKYFELMSGSTFVERDRTFRVAGVVAMDELKLERELAPLFPGLTDVDRCADWDVGIPMEEEQLEDEANEAYWDAYRQTPKAMVSLAAGQAMWSNRFGDLTGVRWLKGAKVEELFREQFDPKAAGYRFEPVRELALASVDQAMDFGQLFVGMSFFLIVAALMLTGLLFVFGVQQRAGEMGMLLATGWRISKVRNLFLLEGGLIAASGSVLGALLGIGYTGLLLNGLSKHWGGAVANSAISLFVSAGTVVTGAVASFICALVAMALAVWRLSGHPARELLQADFSQEFQSLEKKKSSRFQSVLPFLLLAAAIGVVGWALSSDLPNVAMPFFGAGSLMLIAGLLFCGKLPERFARRQGLASVTGLAVRNITRRKGRSLTVAGLLACGSFLVFSVSTMKEDLVSHADAAWSGTGGFEWFGESTLPIKDDLGGVNLRVKDGDDASCLNLNRARRPRLLGVEPGAMSDRKAFMADEDVWQLLQLDLPDGVVPALVGDADTAMWGLEAKVGPEQGDVLDYVDDAGRAFKVKLVGALPMRLSVFQGALLIGEADFMERFPSEAGYRMFLFNEPVKGRKLDRAGFDSVRSVERLLEFYAVESTYLAMFLVLGIFGLVVGSAGVGIVVLRNVQDRKAELAMLRALGYRTAELKRMLLLEHGILTAVGFVIGLVAAFTAMFPALFLSGTAVSIGFMSLLLLGVVASCGISLGIAVSLSVRGDALAGLRSE